MPIDVTAIGAQGNMNANQVPSAQTVDARLRQAQTDLLRNMDQGTYNGPIDEERLMQAMYHSGPTPAEWAKQESANNQAIRNSAAAYWDKKGKQAKEQWLNKPKIAEVVEEVALGKVAKSSEPVKQTSSSVVANGFRSGAPFSEKEPKSERMSFLEAMKPGTIKNAYSNILVDLRRWDDLPQATSLEKFQECFLSAERIGAIVCTCILMVTLITFVVILTM